VFVQRVELFGELVDGLLVFLAEQRQLGVVLALRFLEVPL